MVNNTKDFEIVNGVLEKYIGANTSVIIPDGVIAIGASAFRNNANIISVNLPEGVIKIGDSAFRFCKNLSYINLPSTLLIISDNAFAICGSLKSIDLPDNIKILGNYAFYKCDSLEKLTIPSSTELVGNYSFAYCSEIQEIIVPHRVKTIGFEAFSNCSALRSVVIQDGVTVIDKYAFRYCANLISLTLPGTLKSIGSWAFYNCSSLSNIIIPASVESIGNDVFAHCKGLESILIEENNPNYKSIEGVVFTKDGTNLLYYPLGSIRTNYIVPSRVKTISRTAFYNSVNLKEVILSDNVATIGNEAFRNCSKLESFVITRGVKEGLTTGGEDMLTDCHSKLKILVSSESLSSYKRKPEWIPYAARIVANIKTVDFWGNNGMIVIDNAITNYKGSQETVLIPNNIHTILPEAFIGRDSIKNIVFESGCKVEVIGEGAFRDCSNLVRISIPQSVKRVNERAFLNCRNLREVTIPNSINIISGELFENCINLSEITLPSTITYIANEAFCACTSLKTIDIPNNVSYIGKEAFRNCTSLDSITVNTYNEDYMSIDGNLYNKEGNILIQYAIGNKRTSFVIPQSVHSIGEYAFAVCHNLTSVTIADSVKTIRTYGFAWCSNLSNIIINRTSKQGITEIEPSALRGYHADLKILVPPDSLEDYRKAEGWSEYYNYIYTNKDYIQTNVCSE